MLKPQIPHDLDVRIRSVNARAVDVPMQRPHPTAGGVLESAPLVLVDLATNAGLVGRAYLFTYTTLALRPLTALINDLGKLIEGHALSPIAVAKLFDGKFRLLGPQGLTGMAAAGIDMAVWDALARSHQLPLYAFLGGSRSSFVAYESLGMCQLEDAVRFAYEATQNGMLGIKFKIGGATVHDDFDFVSAIQRAVGPYVHLMVDYNQSLGPAEAIRRGKMLDTLGLYWIEEPCRADDDRGHAGVARALDTPLQLGENWWGPNDMARSLALEACDEVMLDIMKIGGVSGWLEAAALAGPSDRGVSSHLFTEYSAHLMSVTRTARYLEWLDLVSPIMQNPLRPANGHVTLTDCPGTGIEWDESAVERFAFA